jgi:hypothetical protein
VQLYGQVIISANVGLEGGGNGTLLSSVNTYRSYSQQGRQESPSPLIVTIGATTRHVHTRMAGALVVYGGEDSSIILIINTIGANW